MFKRTLILAAVLVATLSSVAFAGGGSFYGGMYRGFDSPNFNRGGGSGGIGNVSPWARRSNSYYPTRMMQRSR
ncbi:MAG: hypothetical protein JSS27_12785 [Planctomycetes bacterium]|nr:hypothetical protein [Planctomycetota bacterium]